MINIGITGQSGFIGTHLFKTLGLFSDDYVLVPFTDEVFDSREELKEWVSRCDVVVHFAALNRHNDSEEIYKTNIRLVRELIEAMEQVESTPHVLFSISTQEDFDNPYGRSKKEGRELLIEWAQRSSASFTGLVIPNVFGPFGHPYYNSVVATFSHQLTHGEQPRIDHDKSLKLIYVGELVEEIRGCMCSGRTDHEFRVPHTSEIRVSEILGLLERYNSEYADNGQFPALARVSGL